MKFNEQMLYKHAKVPVFLPDLSYNKLYQSNLMRRFPYFLLFTAVAPYDQFVH